MRTRSKLSLGVVIPCRDNSRRLRGVLESLRRQTVAPDAVVAVDDNSCTLEQRRLRRLCRAYGIGYARLATPNDRMQALGRRSAARNLGTRCLRTDVILYLDGDMLLGPGYVEAIRSHHAGLERIYVRGSRFGFPESRQRRGIESCLNAVSGPVIPPATGTPRYVVVPATHVPEHLHGHAYVDRWEWCASNNLSVRAEHVSRIGGWDEGFVGWGEEDMDFSFRLHQSGLTPVLLLDPAAACLHLDHPVDHDANVFSLRRNAARLLSKFPQIADRRTEAYARYGIDVDDLRLAAVPSRSCR